jgi:hypothetical protein
MYTERVEWAWAVLAAVGNVVWESVAVATVGNAEWA